MCGIAGIVRFNPRDVVEEARLKRMRDVLRHRGPDGEGLWIDGTVGLAHRRLAALHRADGGGKPHERARSAPTSPRGVHLRAAVKLRRLLRMGFAEISCRARQEVSKWVDRRADPRRGAFEGSISAEVDS